MNTISADMPTSNRNVLALLACGCQVIGVPPTRNRVSLRCLNA
jgi:hypothetical protein